MTNAKQELLDGFAYHAALQYAQAGIPVFPCLFGKKIPAIAGGFKAATTNGAQIDEWFKGKRANIGIPTGQMSGTVVIDNDCYHEMGSGLAGLVQELGPLPDTYTVKTRAGGYQYYFQYPVGYQIGSSAGAVALHVDIRGNGGYVVAPPSWVAEDEKGAAGYYTIEEDLPVAELPRAWADRLSSPKKAEGQTEPERAKGGFELPTVIPEGQRSAVLLKYAGHLRGRGVPEDIIEQTLHDANQARCKPPLDTEEVLSIAGRYARAASVSPWEPPQALPDALQPVVPFDSDALLPKSLAPWVRDVAERMDCPIDFLGVAIMVACGSLIGAQLGVRPKRVDDWHEVPNLWGVIIGRSGVKKSPAISEMLKPLREIEAAASSQHEHDMGLHRLSLAQHEQELAGKKTKAKNGKYTLTLEDTTAPQAPPERRYIVNDTTVEALGIILQDNPTGTLALQDELAGLLSKLDQEERRSERAFYLETYNGKNRVTVDRITRGRVTIPRACLSMLGTTQPDTVKNYLRATVRGGVGNDGLMQRFQLAVYPDRQTGAVRYVDRAPDSVAQEQVRQVFTRLDTLDPHALGADVSGAIPTLGFSDEAAPAVQKFLVDHGNIMRYLDAHSAMISHYSKYGKTIPTLALIVHLAEGDSGPISLAAFQKALAWMKYLRSHAKRIYSSVSQGHHEAARLLSVKLKQSLLTDGFTLRDVTRKGWTQLTEKEEVKEALELLTDLGWLQATEERALGRPTVRYWINPRLNEQ